jgi:hypothetical protein
MAASQVCLVPEIFPVPFSIIVVERGLFRKFPPYLFDFLFASFLYLPGPCFPGLFHYLDA